MSFESLFQDINSQVEKKKQELSSQYNNELEEFQKQLQEEVNQYRESLYDLYSQYYLNKRATLLGSAHSKANAIKLQNKKEYESRIKEETKEKLKNLNKDDKKQCYEKFLNVVKKEFDFSIIEIIPEDKSLIKSLISDKIKVITNKSMIGGFKVYNDDKSYSIDLRFEVLLEELFEELITTT